LHSEVSTCNIFIPEGYDIFNTELFGNYESINDQIAFFKPELLNTISNFYLFIKDYYNTDYYNTDYYNTEYNMDPGYIDSGYMNINENGLKLPKVSEILFKKYLEINNIRIHRIKLNYKLILSPCNIIAICGDSSAGKTTLSKIIEEILPQSDRLILETDRYHKWERGDENYKSITHLNPYANHLEKMSEDVYKLKIGENIYSVDYDHNIGKFTPVEKIEATTNIILCGLHTLYLDELKPLLDLKIFLDTDRNLSTIWKIKRDLAKRGTSINKLINNMQTREPDYYKYIDTQKQNAEIIIKYFQDNEIDLKTIIENSNFDNNFKIDNNPKLNEILDTYLNSNEQIQMQLKVRTKYLKYIKQFLDMYKDNIILDYTDDWIIILFPNREHNNIDINCYDVILKNFFTNIIYN
jgi:uridine kinase